MTNSAAAGNVHVDHPGIDPENLLFLDGDLYQDWAGYADGYVAASAVFVVCPAADSGGMFRLVVEYSGCTSHHLLVTKESPP